MSSTITLRPPRSVARASVTIALPVGDVFAFICNHENYPSWFPGVLSVHQRDHTPHGSIGKTYDETLTLPSGRQRTITVKLVAADPPVMLVTEADFAPLHPRTQFALSAVSDHETRLDWTFLTRSQSAIGRWLIPLLLGRLLTRQGTAGLTALKARLERPGG